MKVLLTGGSGMVGRNILEHKDASQYKILSPSRDELNLLDRDQVQVYLKKELPDFVIHTAGRVGGIEANLSNQLEFFRENIDIGMNLIYSTYSLGIKKLINLSSSCMYPKDADNPITESMILKGQLETTNEGYALSKTVTTRLCEYINMQDRGRNFKTIIPCNIYGRHDNFNKESSHLIPAIISKIHKAKVSGLNEVKIWGDGKARREMMFAADLADFIFLAIDRFEELPQNINVGLGQDHTVLEYYKIVADVLGYKGEFKFDLTKPKGVHQKTVDITLLKKLNWQSNTKLFDGISQAYNFFKEGLRNEL